MFPGLLSPKNICTLSIVQVVLQWFIEYQRVAFYAFYWPPTCQVACHSQSHHEASFQLLSWLYSSIFTASRALGVPECQYPHQRYWSRVIKSICVQPRKKNFCVSSGTNPIMVFGTCSVPSHLHLRALQGGWI